MANSFKKNVFNFVKGKNTESSALNYTEGTARELYNFFLHTDGSVRKRLGIDIETDGTFEITKTFSEIQNAGLSAYRWDSVGGEVGLDFAVVQVGYSLYFYDLRYEPISLGYIGTIDLSSYRVFASDSEPFGFSTGAGVLYVVGKYLSSLYIEYNDGSFTATAVNIKIRDFSGVDDSLDIDFRPTSLSDAHKYNLYNQGWPTGEITASINENGGGVKRDVDALAYTYQKIGVYPSNADIYSSAKISTANTAAAVNSFSPWELEKVSFGTRTAPRGHFILDAFLLDRSSESGIDIDDDLLFEGRPITRPTCVCFFSSRVVFSGDDTGNIYISKMIKSSSDSGICYQEQDPTSEETNALLATDGMVIRIPESGRVVAVKVAGDALVAICANGVWAIVGGADTGFTAEAYSIYKVSNAGCLSPGSVVEIDGAVFYWSDRGIYIIAPDNTSGKLSSTNISEQSIQTDYDNIPSDSKSYCAGMYDFFGKRVFWLYHDEGGNSSAGIEKYRYNSILVFDVRLGAFYDLFISESSGFPFISGAINTSSSMVEIEEQDVFVDEDLVLVGGDTVVIDAEVFSSKSPGIKFLSVHPASTNRKFAFSEFSNTDFVDWYSHDTAGLDFTGKIVTGQDIVTAQTQSGYATSAAIRKSAVYVIMHFNQTESELIDSGDGLVFDRPSGCLLRAKWDFTDSASFGKWSDQYETYRINRNFIPSGAGAFAYGREVITTKSRVRGSGKAISIELTTVAGKDCQLLGWETLFNAAGRV